MKILGSLELHSRTAMVTNAGEPMEKFHAAPGAARISCPTLLSPAFELLKSLPRFARWLFAVQSQLTKTDDIVGYSLLAHPLKRDFWTLSAWSDKAALNKFFRSAPHADAMKALRTQMAKRAF